MDTEGDEDRDIVRAETGKATGMQIGILSGTGKQDGSDRETFKGTMTWRERK
jgi:hypothetical protein